MVGLKLPRVERSRSLADDVAEELRRQVAGGTLKPGDRLPTGAELSAGFGVSLAVVREAMSRLKHDGLIETQQGSGAYVADLARPKSFRLDGREGIGHEVLVQTLEMRLAIEGEATRLAAIRRDAAQLDRMRGCLEALDGLSGGGAEGVAADQAFHRLVAEASGNPQILDFWNFLSRHIEEAIAAARANSARTGLGEKARREHRAIYDAVAAADPIPARDAATAHVRAAALRMGITLV